MPDRRRLGGLVALALLLRPSPGHAAPLGPDELATLSELAFRGVPGRVGTSRTVVAPGSSRGFSVELSWEPPKGLRQRPLWSVLQPLPALDVGGDDARVELQLRVERAAEPARLTVFLYESDGDRWLVWSGELAPLRGRGWQRIEVPRGRMQPWLLGDRRLQWERIEGFALELSDASATLHVDAVRVRGAGRTREVFDPTWRDPWPAEAAPRTIPPAPAPGTTYFPGLANPRLGDTVEKLDRLLDHVGTSAGSAAEAASLARRRVPTVHYSPLATGYQKLLAHRGAFEVGAHGQRFGSLPSLAEAQHLFALGHPGAFEAGRRRAEALVRAGIGIWMLVDYVFPHQDGPFGYAPAMVEAYRRDLLGRDEGLVVQEGGSRRPLRFQDYFRAYNGFFPEPAGLGLGRWEDFVPPVELRTEDRARWTVFLYLRSYEWVKLADRIGRYYGALGGQGLWVVPNPEDPWGSSDYAFLLRTAGVRGLLPEWFLPAGDMAEATYASLGMLRQEADRSGARLGVLFETGFDGSGLPYWDWRVAFGAAYALSAAARADDFDDDFLHDVPFDVMRDPASGPHFQRFRDGVAKARAFLLVREEGATRPTTEVLCVSERPPARTGGSFFFRLGQPHTFARALSRAHVLFDLRDSLDLEGVLGGYRVIFYSPLAPRVGDIARLRAWLAGRPGRVLITHSFVPTRDASGYHGLDDGVSLGSAGGGALLGLGAITPGAGQRAKIRALAPGWERVLRIGEELALPTLVRTTGGEVVVDSDLGPLVSRVRIGASELLYLHFAPGSEEGAGLRLMARIAREMAARARVQPLVAADAEVAVQAFDVPGGRSLLLWDGPALARFHQRRGEAPLAFAAPGIRRDVSVPASGGGAQLVYDFWAETRTRVQPTEGRLRLGLRDAVFGLLYVGADTPQFRATVERAASVRRWLRGLGFDGPP